MYHAIQEFIQEAGKEQHAMYIPVIWKQAASI
jgi:hypothetical protein